jgi:hypothetical protein
VELAKASQLVPFLTCGMAGHPVIVDSSVRISFDDLAPTRSSRSESRRSVKHTCSTPDAHGSAVDAWERDRMQFEPWDEAHERRC